MLPWLGAISAITFVVSLLALPWLVALIPQDYFLHRERRPAPWKQLHPILRMCLITAKNLLGLLLFVGGLLMLFLPGQGLLTMLMGILLMDYPGKYQLERKLVCYPKVLRGLNWLRKKGRRPPLEVDGE